MATHVFNKMRRLGLVLCSCCYEITVNATVKSPFGTWDMWSNSGFEAQNCHLGIAHLQLFQKLAER